jgi:hypothetical protein
MPDRTLALLVAFTALVAAVGFIAYALTGADLCLWCRVLSH